MKDNIDCLGSTGSAAVAEQDYLVRIQVEVGALPMAGVRLLLDGGDAGNGLVFELAPYMRHILNYKQDSFMAKSIEKVVFVIVTPEDLGFTEDPTREVLFDERRLIKDKLGLCQASDVPNLRLAHKDQSSGDELIVAMRPLYVTLGVGVGFRLVRMAHRLLISTDCFTDPQSRLGLRDPIIFRDLRYRPARSVRK